MKIDINKTRSQFPILQQQVNKRPLVYFDNAATTQTLLKLHKQLLIITIIIIAIFIVALTI